MVTDFKELAASLEGPLDWAVALAAGTIGLVLDGAINIVPIPFFSPGICAGVAASSAVALKKSLQAGWVAREIKRRRRVLRREADRLVREMLQAGTREDADELAFEVELAGDNLAELEHLVRVLRNSLPASAEGAVGTPFPVASRGSLGTAAPKRSG